MKHTPFFITGLPRSRTAWLANLFTTDTTLCYHDRMWDVELTQRTDKHVGFSCSELVNQQEAIRSAYPNAKWLLVVRNASDALESFQKFQRGTLPSVELSFEWEKRHYALEMLSHRRNVLTVKFEELDDPHVVESAWRHLLPYKPWDAERFQLLNELRVEQHWDKAVANRKELITWQ